MMNLPVVDYDEKSWSVKFEGGFVVEPDPQRPNFYIVSRDVDERNIVENFNGGLICNCGYADCIHRELVADRLDFFWDLNDPYRGVDYIKECNADLVSGVTLKRRGIGGVVFTPDATYVMRRVDDRISIYRADNRCRPSYLWVCTVYNGKGSCGRLCPHVPMTTGI